MYNSVKIFVIGYTKLFLKFAKMFNMLFYVCVPIKKLSYVTCMTKRSSLCDFRSYRCVYQVWSWLVIQLGDTSYDGEHRSCNRVFEMFTSSTTDATKERILNDFRAGRVRVVVATVAFGIGVSYFHNNYNSLRHFSPYKTIIYHTI